MARRNLTVQLDAEVIQRARVLAAQRSTSVSRLVADQIQALVEDDDRYEGARRHALAALGRGFGSGGEPLPKRDDLHDR